MPTTAQIKRFLKQQITNIPNNKHIAIHVHTSLKDTKPNCGGWVGRVPDGRLTIVIHVNGGVRDESKSAEELLWGTNK